MREVKDRFTPPPLQPGLLFECPQLKVVWRNSLFQTLVSGDLEAASATLGVKGPTVGLHEIVTGDTAKVRISRDRMLLVSSVEPTLVEGWNTQGWAVTKMDGGYRVLEFSGGGATAILREGTSVDFESGSPSAATLFAGCWALLYRTSEEVVRLHLEAPMLPHAVAWLSGLRPKAEAS